MRFSPLNFLARHSLLCVMAGLPLAGTGEVSDKFEGLLRNSPFGQSVEAAPKGDAQGDLEFRSLMVQGGRTYFSIHDTATRRSAWIELNDPVEGVLIKDYDASDDSITLTHRGSPLTLTLKRSVVIARTAPPATGAGAVTASLASPTGEGAITSQQRKQLVQEELARRRARGT